MSRNTRLNRRRGFATAMSLLMLIVIGGLLTVTWTLAARSLKLERRMALETRAEAALQSARAWSVKNADKLRQSGVVKLPIERLMPEDAAGELELRLDRGKPKIIECRLVLALGAIEVKRNVRWPAD